jgi:hypothetical protein
MTAEEMVIAYIDDDSREAAPQGADATSTPAGDSMGVRVRIDFPMKSDRFGDGGAETTFGAAFDKITQQAPKDGIVAGSGQKKMGKIIHWGLSSSGDLGVKIEVISKALETGGCCIVLVIFKDRYA